MRIKKSNKPADQKELIARLVAFIEEWGSWEDGVPMPDDYVDRTIGAAYDDAKAYLAGTDRPEVIAIQEHLREAETASIFLDLSTSEALGSVIAAVKILAGVK